MKAFTSDQLLAQFERHNIDIERQHFLCGLSGGMDSSVLLHSLSQLSNNVRCVHIDHAIHPDSAAWASFCQKLCEDLSCSIKIKRLNVDQAQLKQASLEEYLRDERRAVFAKTLGANEILLLAHHLDDQAETFFLRSLRGSGVKGLAAMDDQLQVFGLGQLLRPLLTVPKQHLQEYALSHGIDWIDDPSNQESQFDRNFWRNQIAPKIQQRWPGYIHSVARAADLSREATGLCRQLAMIDMNLNDDLTRLEFAAIRQLDEARLCNVLRYWIERLGLKSPPRQRIKEAVRQFVQAGTDRHPQLAWSEGRITRYRDELIFTAGGSSENQLGITDQTSLVFNQWITLPSGAGALRLSQVIGQGLDAQKLLGSSLKIGFRQGGERMLLANGQHQRLKHWFQQEGIEPAARARIPLLLIDDEIIAIADRWLNPQFLAASEERGWRVDWRLF